MDILCRFFELQNVSFSKLYQNRWYHFLYLNQMSFSFGEKLNFDSGRESIINGFGRVLIIKAERNYKMNFIALLAHSESKLTRYMHDAEIKSIFAVAQSM